jgi:hypothetical protein
MLVILFSRAFLQGKSAQGFSISPQVSSQPKSENLGIDETSAFLLQKFRSQKLRYALTKSNYRVDVGFIVDRAPIFLSYTEEEMKWFKYHYNFEKKYKLNFETTKDLMEFVEKNPMEQYDKQNPDNLITHIKQDEKGKPSYYSEYSKLFKVADPAIHDPKNIQYSALTRVYLLVKNKETSKWGFPSGTIYEKETFEDGKVRLFHQISKNKFSVSYNTHVPFVVEKRDLTPTEIKNALNKKAIGVKTFYYWASHVQGRIGFDENLYNDYVWAPKTEMNRYLEKEIYENFIHSLVLF